MLRTYTLLNVVAHPHPEGTYRSLFERAADRNPVKFRGERYARISPISSTEDGVFRGYLATWMEIDPSSPSIQKSSLKQQSLAEAGIRLPDDIGFNSRLFLFAFRENGHALYVETVNEDRQTLTPSTAKSAFSAILQDAKGDLEDVAVHIAARRDAIDYVLGLPSIRKVVIDLNLPNPDDLSEDHRRILEEIEEMNAKRVEAAVTKKAGADTLILSERYRVLADLAKDNGSVSAQGRDAEGKRQQRSTKDVPAKIEEEIEGSDTGYGTIARVAREGRELSFSGLDDDDNEVLE